MSAELDLSFDFSAALGKEVDKVRGNVDKLRRFRFIQRRLNGNIQTPPAAGGTITQDCGSPNVGSLWALSCVYNGQLSPTPWAGINQTNWLGGALCIGDANAFTPNDIICIFGTSTLSPGSANPDFVTFPTDSVWIYPSESLYVAQQFANGGSPTCTTVVVREYLMDDVMPSSL